MNLINARVPGLLGLQQISGDAGGKIVEIAPMNLGGEHLEDSLDVAGDWISLGGIDLQINGALGLPFPDLDENCFEKLEEICHYLWEVGVDGFLPTIVTTSVEKIHQAFSILSKFMGLLKSPGTAEILGVHLEGPFLNTEKRGAHPAQYLLPLTVEEVKRVLGDYSSLVKIITLAPELDETETVIPYLKNLGITVSLGHSMATANQANRAFAQGASLVTHAFNAMPSLHHRHPGLLGAAMIHPDVKCGLIADGQHVCPTMIEILLKASDYDQGIFLVSDALSPFGLPDGIYGWDQRQIAVKNGTAQLLEGTLAGTTLSLLTGVQNLVKWGICSQETAIALATISPRKALNLNPDLIGKKITELLQWEGTENLTWKRINFSHN